MTLGTVQEGGVIACDAGHERYERKIVGNLLQRDDQRVDAIFASRDGYEQWTSLDVLHLPEAAQNIYLIRKVLLPKHDLVATDLATVLSFPLMVIASET